MWIDESMCTAPAAQTPKRGHPLVYSDALIQGLLGLKQVFRLPLRALQGFAGSLRKLAFPDLPIRTTRRCLAAHRVWRSCCLRGARASLCTW